MGVSPTLVGICQNCGTVFGVKGLFQPDTGSTEQIRFTRGMAVGPCPSCSGKGAIPEGLHVFTEDALNIFTTWTPERLQAFIDGLTAARRADNPRVEVERLIKSDPDLAVIWKHLSPIESAATFWGFATFLQTAALLILALESSGGTTIEHQTVIGRRTVIGHIISQPQPTVPGK